MKKLILRFSLSIVCFKTILAQNVSYVDVSSFTTGFYIIKVNQNNKTWSSKFLKN